MSVLFNLLLFVGVFYLILSVPEPGDRRWKGGQATTGKAAPARKVA